MKLHNINIDIYIDTPSEKEIVEAGYDKTYFTN